MSKAKKLENPKKTAIKKFLLSIRRPLWSILITIIIVLLSRQLYFAENPLFNYPLLGESLSAAIIFLLIFFYGPTIYRFTVKWLENLARITLQRILVDFWKVQTEKLVEAMKRENVVKAEKLPKYKHVILDTSSIIDGRIFPVIKTGFLDNVIVVSQNVVDELQFMADKSNPLKRQKGRIGLDNLRDIKKFLGKHRFKIIEMKTKPEDVDGSLVKFCKKNHSKLATVDYNLNKAAQVAGVQVLNINKLANEIKTNLLPGDSIVIKFIQKGSEDGQAVGYLEDGTMIVVNDAQKYIKEEKEVIVEKVLQTSAGKMIFATLPK